MVLLTFHPGMLTWGHMQGTLQGQGTEGATLRAARGAAAHSKATAGGRGQRMPIEEVEATGFHEWVWGEHHCNIFQGNSLLSVQFN